MPPNELSDSATALQALLGSLSSEDGTSSADVARKLSEKLDELVGGVSNPGQLRNEKGEVCICYTRLDVIQR